MKIYTYFCLKNWIKLHKINLKKTSGDLVRTELNLHGVGVGLASLHLLKAVNGSDVELETLMSCYYGCSGAFREVEVAAAEKTCPPQACKRTHMAAQERLFLMLLKWILHLSKTHSLHFAVHNALLCTLRIYVFGRNF